MTVLLKSPAASDRGVDPTVRVPAAAKPAALPRKTATTFVDVETATTSSHPSLFMSTSDRTFNERPAAAVLRVNPPVAVPYSTSSPVVAVVATTRSIKPS
jgi:hypothetical protein